MRTFLKYLILKLMGREITIASITSPMAKILDDLEKFATEKSSKAVTHLDEALKLKAQAQEAEAAALEATKIASVYKNLVLPAAI